MKPTILIPDPLLRTLTEAGQSQPQASRPASRTTVNTRVARD